MKPILTPVAFVGLLTLNLQAAAPLTTIPSHSSIPPAVAWEQQCAERVASFKDQPCDIIFIGDSITQNFIEFPKNGWNLVGGAVWEKYYGKRHALDFGVGGDATQNTLWRMENMGIENLRPKVAVIMLGMNNQNDTPADAAAGTKAVIQKTRTMFPLARVILTSVTANGRMPEKTLQINAILKTYDDNLNVFYVDLYSKMPGQNGGWKGVGGDKVHLTPEGYELWAESIEPLVKRFLGNQP